MLEDKTYENLIRRATKRQGYTLVKSRRRDPLARDFGTYGVTDGTGSWVFADEETGYGKSLSDVAEWLTDRDRLAQAGVKVARYEHSLIHGFRYSRWSAETALDT